MRQRIRHALPRQMGSWDRFRRRTWPERLRSYSFQALLVLLLAAGLRFHSLGFGLDLENPERAVHHSSIDEIEMVNLDLKLLDGNWHPKSFLMRGTGGYYAFGLVDALAVGLAARLRGETWEESVAHYQSNQSLILLVHRSLSALAGVLTTWVLMRICRRELGRRSALIAGLLLASSFAHVFYSHLGLVDVLWVLFALLALDRILRLIRDPRRTNYLMAGLWIGISGAVKYPGMLLFLQLVLAHWLAHSHALRRREAPPSFGRLASACAPLVLAFLALSTHLFFWPEAFLAAVKEQLSVHGNDEISRLLTLLWHVQHTLLLGLGEPATLAAGLGLLLALWRGGRARQIALCALLFVPSALMTKLCAPRFGLGMLVASIPLAALAIEFLTRRLARPWRALLVLIVLAPALLRSISFNLVLQGRDTRSELVEELMRRGTRPWNTLALGVSGLPEVPGTPDPGRARPYTNLLSKLRKGKSTLAEELLVPPKYLIFELYCSRIEPKEAEEVWRAVHALAERDYEEVFRVEGWRDPASALAANRAYKLLRTGIPMAAPWQKTRSGESFALYKLKKLKQPAKK